MNPGNRHRLSGLSWLLGLSLLVASGCGDGGASAPQTTSGAKVTKPAEAEPAPASPAPGGAPYRTAAQCGTCHHAIYEEWKASMHGQAMSDYLYLELPTERSEECIRCHAPVPIRDVDFDVPIARLDRREDAVSCLSCHQAGDHMAGPSEGMEDAPCRPIHDPAQENVVKMCFGCHNQHDTGTEWLNSAYGPHAAEPRARPPTSCLDCHMPVVTRPIVEGGKPRRSHRHTWPGGHDLALLQKAAEIEVAVEPLEGGGKRFRVWVKNVGAGHNIPTDARHRSFDTYVKLWDAGGNVILDPLDPAQQRQAHAAVYRKFYRNSGVRDTQIPPLARISTLEASKGYVDVPEAKRGRGEAWLVYRLTPDDQLEAKSLSTPEDFQFYRARVVARTAFTYGE